MTKDEKIIFGAIGDCSAWETRCLILEASMTTRDAQIKASEERERDHAEEIERLRSFQLNYEHATKIERADFQQKIEMLQERERVLREALEYCIVLDNLYVGNDFRVQPKGSDAAHLRNIWGQMIDYVESTLATPAPQQPAQPSAEKAESRQQMSETLYVPKSQYEAKVVQLNERIATLTAERDSAKRELAEIQADAKAERKKYEALREERDALAATVERLDWQPITPENLPKVGDEVYAPTDGELEHDSVMNVTLEMIDGEADYDSWHHEGWTHFRPINPPIIAARTTPPAKEPK